MSILDDIHAYASAEYLAYCVNHSDEQSVGDCILLYGQSYIVERNETYELPNYLSGWCTIGDDGGGAAIWLQLNGSPAVSSCGHGAIGSLDPELVADSFAGWLDAECPASWMIDDDDYDDDYSASPVVQLFRVWGQRG